MPVMIVQAMKCIHGNALSFCVWGEWIWVNYLSTCKSGSVLAFLGWLQQVRIEWGHQRRYRFSTLAMPWWIWSCSRDRSVFHLWFLPQWLFSHWWWRRRWIRYQEFRADLSCLPHNGANMRISLNSNQVQSVQFTWNGFPSHPRKILGISYWFVNDKSKLEGPNLGKH